MTERKEEKLNLDDLREQLIRQVENIWPFLIQLGRNHHLCPHRKGAMGTQRINLQTRYLFFVVFSNLTLF
jgi:hypothetical protein